MTSQRIPEYVVNIFIVLLIALVAGVAAGVFFSAPALTKAFPQ